MMISVTILMLSVVIMLGLWLSDHAHIGHFSLGVTWVLFIGLLFSAFGLQINGDILQFAKNFGLVLFVYSIGLQVGPSFSPFKRGGLRLNLLAGLIVLLGCACAIVLHYLTHIDMGTMSGILSGAVISTPSLAAAEQAYSDLFGMVSPTIATAYAISYPLAVLGVILAFLLIRRFFRVDLRHEEQLLQQESEAQSEEPVCVDITLSEMDKAEWTVADLRRIAVVPMVVSRVIRPDGSDELVNESTRFQVGDIVRILSDKQHVEGLRVLGAMQAYSFSTAERSAHLVSRRIAVTRPECNGKRIASFNLSQQYHVTITRVNRAGFDLLATPNLILQLGDRLIVVGDQADVEHVTSTFGNELKRLDIPNLFPIFLGLALGVLLGLIPIPIPGMHQTFRLGLAGGALIVALLIGRFGPYYNMVTFTTTSASLMLRQVGLTLFLAALGLSAGSDFLPAILDGGYMWVVYGFLITLVPLLIVGTIAYRWMHLNYFKVIGLLTGAMTAAPALGYAESLTDTNDQASVCYATVYPFTTFLRVMAAQLLVLIFCS